MVEYCGPRELVLDGQSVSRDTDPEYRPKEHEETGKHSNVVCGLICSAITVLPPSPVDHF